MLDLLRSNNVLSKLRRRNFKTRLPVVLWDDLPPTLIRHEKGASRKSSFKTGGIWKRRVCVVLRKKKHFELTERFENEIIRYSRARGSLKQKSKCRTGDYFSL